MAGASVREGRTGLNAHTTIALRGGAARRRTGAWVGGTAAVAFCAAAALAAQPTLIDRGATWRYLDDGSDQGTAWREPAFDDSGWALGAAQLGYGDGDEVTVVSFGPDGNDKYITTYFRRTFFADDAASVTQLTLYLQRDDGAVVYLNGVEVGRSNMTLGTITYLTPASSAVGDDAEAAFSQMSLPAAGLVEGENVLAVEIHQSSPTSSDISFDAELIAGTGGPLLNRGPYLQSGTDSGVTICWRTDDQADGRVWYGLSPNVLDTVVDDPASLLRHSVQLDGLAPGTTYYYAVGTSAGVLRGGDATYRFTTAPPAGARLPARVWVIGDSGTADANAAAVLARYRQHVGGEPAQVWLMLGDNAYNSGTQAEFDAAVFDMYPQVLRSTVLWPTLGNHDAMSADSPTENGPYYSIFVLPRAGEAGGVPSGTEAYYSFDYANVHFICLDSEDSDRSAGGAMMTWLAADLADTLQDWIIAFWHHPPYSKGSHDSDDPADSGGRMRDMREAALPILEAGGVDLVLTGHSHSYERSYLLNGHYGVSGTLDPGTMILDAGDGDPGGDGAYRKLENEPNAGAVYAVAGSSGQTGGGPLNHPVMHVSLNTLGSMLLDIDDNRLHAVFLDADGAVQDSFAIVHTPECPGDLDHDRSIGVADLRALLSNFGALSGMTHQDGDLDGDQAVTLPDLSALLTDYGSACP